MVSSVGQSSQFSTADEHNPFANLLAQLASSDKQIAPLVMYQLQQAVQLEILFNKVKTQITFPGPAKISNDNKIKIQLTISYLSEQQDIFHTDSLNQ